MVRRTFLALCTSSVLALGAVGCAPTTAPGPHSQAPTDQPPSGQPVATGYDGAVASVDPYATQAGIDVLRAGGNAVDAAVATAAALGVVEPYSAGVGGGGFLVYYDAHTRQVHTLDGRETAPAAMRQDAFVDPATGKPLPFDQAVNSGLSVGVPGTPMTWHAALTKWGSISLATALEPAARIAEAGFVVDEEFRAQTVFNEQRFKAIAPTAGLFLPQGQPPVVGSVLRNPDLARTYRLLGASGVDVFYRGEIAGDIVRTVRQPPVAVVGQPSETPVGPGAPAPPVRPGLMTAADLAAYTVPQRKPVRATYHGLEVYGMAPPSSGGTTVGETLAILDTVHLSAADRLQALHHYLEASRLAYADRNRWVGDPAHTDVPVEGLLSKEYAKDRACLISPVSALPGAVAPGEPGPGGNRPGAGGPATCPEPAPPAGAQAAAQEGPSTTHLVTADRWGNVVSYTLTIEQTGGSAITVPGRGFLLNNELTDFTFAPALPGNPEPNLPAGGKRPRSSIAPTIVLRDGTPFLALGSPGGATIITTVVQVLLGRLDLGMTLPDAIAAPRVSQRNADDTEAEPAFLDTPERAGLDRLGHRFVQPPASFTPRPEIGAVTALEFLGNGRIEAAAEPLRRGGGSAMVVRAAH